MTVHGAKGLQAPLVILPDTTALPPEDGIDPVGARSGHRLRHPVLVAPQGAALRRRRGAACRRSRQTVGGVQPAALRRAHAGRGPAADLRLGAAQGRAGGVLVLAAAAGICGARRDGHAVRTVARRCAALRHASDARRRKTGRSPRTTGSAGANLGRRRPGLARRRSAAGTGPAGPAGAEPARGHRTRAGPRGRFPAGRSAATGSVAAG